MAGRNVVRRDTPSWIFQVWASFAVALALATIGVWHVPNLGLERSALAIGFFFCLSSTLTLAKTIRDNRDQQVDTTAWMIQVWGAFLIANVLTAWGLYGLAVDPWQRGYIVATWLYMLTSAFTLAKTIRDNHEADVLDAARSGPEAVDAGPRAEKKSLSA